MIGKPTIIDYFRNITFVVFVFSIIAYALGYQDFSVLSVPYIFMEICAILHRLFRFRTKQIEAAGAERQMKYSGFFVPRHALDLKFVAFFRRTFLAFTVGFCIKMFLSSIDKWVWIPCILIILNIVTFVKGWYIFRTKWEGAYSVPTLYIKQISTDFTFPAKCINDLKEHDRGAVLKLIVSIIVIVATVCFVLFL